MSEKKEIDLRRFFRGVRKYRWICCLVFVMFMSLGIFYWKVGMPRYDTFSAMLIEDSASDGTMKTGGGAGMMSLMKTFSLGGFGTSSANNEIVLINSHDVILRTVKELGINRTYVRKNGFYKELLFRDTPVLLEAPQEMMDTMTDGCKITVDIKGKTADISVSTGRFKPTYWEKQGVTLPATVKTPSGPVQILRTEHFDGTPQKIVIGFSSYNAAVALLVEDLKVTPTSKLSEGLTFSYHSPNKERNEMILNTIMGVYNDKRLRRKRETANQEINFLDERINALFNDLTNVQEEMAEYKEKYNLMGIEDQAQVLAESAIQNQAEVVKVQAQILYYEELLRSLKNPVNKDNLLPVFNEEGYQMIKDYNELLLKKKDLERSAKENNANLVTITNQVAEMRSSVIDNVSGLLQAARIADKAQSDLISTATGRLRSLPQYEKEYINLFRDQKLKNELYVFLLEKRESAVLKLYSQNTLGFIIDEAFTAVKPNNSKKFAVLAICFALGLIFPSIFVVWRMRKDNHVYGPMDLAFIGLEKNSVIYTGEKAQIALTRTMLTDHSDNKIFIATFSSSGNGLDILRESFEATGRRVRTLTPSDADLPNTNDGILHTAFSDLISEAAESNDIVFVPIPQPELTYELTSLINKHEAALVLDIEPGIIRRPELKKALKGLDASHIYTIIDRSKDETA